VLAALATYGARRPVHSRKIAISTNGPRASENLMPTTRHNGDSFCSLLVRFTTPSRLPACKASLCDLIVMENVIIARKIGPIAGWWYLEKWCHRRGASDSIDPLALNLVSELKRSPLFHVL
jgi:hypothetical protein